MRDPLLAFSLPHFVMPDSRKRAYILKGREASDRRQMGWIYPL
jgi:hypothetical protein